MNIAALKCGEERTDYARAAHAVCLNVSVVLLEELVWYLPVEYLSFVATKIHFNMHFISA